MMKKFLLFISLLICCHAFSQGINSVVPARPSPPKLVNDLADVLTSEQEQLLERKLLAYEDSTTTQIAIVTVHSIGDYDVADVGLQILRQWQVGTKEKNNGVVILAAIDDHKIDIETGYGMEGALPDITARTIIENDIVPNFRQGNYYQGLDAATTSIFQSAAGEYKAPEGYQNKAKGSGKSIGKIIVALIVLFVLLGMMGGGGGNRGGGYMSRRGSSSWLGPFILGSMLGRGSGGGWSGGGGGWSGGGGGGFGGFGGGSGGGGGASGSW